ncbi:hypothetical protein FRC0549_01066 [Corynebacterium diphtheriae]|nr:hypothetical protein FRC0549_01066 [Corynebacterium diphtheriae]
MTTELVSIPFHGQSVQSVEIDGKPHVVFRPLVESLGLDADSQMKRLRRHSWATTVKMTGVGLDGKNREMTCIDLRTLTMWLATIDENRVSEEARPLVVAYQNEVADAIESYWAKGGAINPRAPKINGAELTRLELIQIAMNAETERLALEAKNKELEPKADAYDSFLDATGKYPVGAVAQMLGMGQNKLFRELRNRKIFIASGSRRNTPYQPYLHHFEVIPHEYEKKNGEMGCSYTTYVQPSGIDFIRRKLNLPTIDPLPEAA